MPTFTYKALNNDGTTTEGRLDAPGRQEAMRQLYGQGLKPIRLNENAVAPSASADSAGLGRFQLTKRLGGRLGGGGGRKVSHRVLENFTRQLSSLLAAGVALSRALQILSREASTPAALEKWRSIHDMVIDGMPLADAMGRHPETFPRVYVAMVQAGEAGGFLDVVLGQIADFQARTKELKDRVRAALIYPAVLMALAIAVLIFLLTFFIPRFQTIFAGFGAALPLLTRIIIGASHSLTQYGPLLAIGAAIVIYAMRQWVRSDHGRRTWEHWMLQLPVVGPLSARFAMTRFCRMLGTLTQSGVALIMALRVARESLGNQTLVDAVSHSIERVKKGDSLAASLAECPTLFPGSVIEMISVAEESGQLDKELVRLATVTEQELDGQLRMAVSLAEPLLLFVMAAFIGTIFVGMVIPIFTIQDYIK